MRRQTDVMTRHVSGDMFTGLVEATGVITGLTPCVHGIKLAVDASGLVPDDVRVGDSVAISGCCLTVVDREGTSLWFDAGEETLRRTVLGRLQVGDQVNLERSLSVAARLGGHFVTGHIDFVGQLARREDDAQWSSMWFRFEPRWAAHFAEKGSVAVDGISLTVVSVVPDQFSVALIPHTLDVTTLGQRVVGDAVNIETDVLAKYVERAVVAAQGS